MLTTSKREKKIPLFLECLRENGGFVNKACEASAISKQTVYNWREADEAFAAQWDAVIELATEDLEKEARRRAHDGVDEPVFYQGEVCGYIRKFSDSLLMFTIKARKPEYRDRVTIDVNKLDSDIDRELAIFTARSQGNPAGKAEGEESIH